MHIPLSFPLYLLAVVGVLLVFHIPFIKALKRLWAWGDRWDLEPMVVLLLLVLTALTALLSFAFKPENIQGHLVETQVLIGQPNPELADDNRQRLINQSYERQESDPGTRQIRLEELYRLYPNHEDTRTCLINHTYDGWESHPVIRNRANEMLTDLAKRGGRS